MKKLFVMFLLVLALCFAYGLQQGEEMTEEEVKALANKVLKIWNEDDFSSADEFYTPDYVRHHPNPSNNLKFEGYKRAVASLRSQFPDYHLVFDDVQVIGNRILILATVTGTDVNIGKKVKISGIYIYRMDNKKIAEEWSYFNLLYFFQQLGYTIVPPEVKKTLEVKK